MEYIDGTKIESKVNKYTFVWCKTVEKNRAKLQDKIRVLLQQIDEVIAHDTHRQLSLKDRSENAHYGAQNSKGCPLWCMCYKAKGNRRIIEVNHRLNEYKRKARELLTSEDRLQHRARRCIEPEAVFGQMKFNMAYRRFRHFGKDKVTMDFVFFAIAFNIKKMCSKIAKQTKNGGNKPHFCLFMLISRTSPTENRLFWNNPQKSVA